MSRLADIMGSIWAAIWVRWELMRARRARRAAGHDGRDELVLPVMAVPVEGVDYELSELEPELQRRLEATAAELLATAPGRNRGARRDRRPLQTVAATAAALLVAALVGASASALLAGTTGVPAVDRALGIWESGLDRDTVPARDGVSAKDVRPAATGPAVAYSVAGEPAGTVASFVGQAGRVCMVHTFASGATGGAACRTDRELADGLRSDGYEALHLEAHGDALVMFGQVAGDVDGLEVDGPLGPLTVDLGASWRPANTDLGAMRPFVAATAIDAETDRRELIARASSWSEYDFRATRRD